MENYKENLFHYMTYIGHPPEDTDLDFKHNHLIVKSGDFNFVLCHYDLETQKVKNIITSIKGLDNIYIIAEEALRHKLEEYATRFIPLVKLITNYPTLMQVPRFELVADPQVLSETQMIDLEELKNILFDDPTSIWLDAQVGDIIKITEPDKISGERIDYRRVIKI